ncbi:MAG: type II toxin-antitoxin system prevent-host-death family antitoxin [Pseudomonadota bacterium]
MASVPVEYPAAEAKSQFSALLDRAENGEEIIIKRHGRPVAKLVPTSRELTVDERRESRLEYLKWRKKHGPRLGPDLTIKDLIEEGRR